MSAATHARRAKRHRRPAWSWLLPLAMVVAAAGIPLLVWYAADAILTSSDGDLQQRTTDPAAAGYEVLVVPSPSHMVLGLDADGALASVAVLSLGSDDRGGTVLLLAPETLVAPERRLVDVYAQEGVDAARRAVAELIDVNTDGFNSFDVQGWAGITGPAAPLDVDNPADLVEVSGSGDMTVRHARGRIEVAADQVAEYMAWQNPEEVATARLDRQQALWRAWVDTIAAANDPAVIPGEQGTGIGRILEGLGSGPTAYRTISGEAVALADGAVGVEVDVPALRDLVLDMIPFPHPVEPGSRPRVRLLDGVGGLDVASTYSHDLIAAGAQIIIIGNAEDFGVERTQVVYHDDRFEAEASAFSKTLGGAEVFLQRVEDAVIDVTIVIGEDIARPAT